MTFQVNDISTLSDITSLYNNIQTSNGEPTVKKFKDKSTASSRLLAIAGTASKKILRKQDVLQEVASGAFTKAEITVTKKAKTKVKAESKTKSGPRTRLTGSTYSVLMDRIPARPNSTLFHCFAFIVEMVKKNPEVTVKEVYEAYNKNEDRTYRSNTDYLSSRTFKIAAAKGLIEIHAAD